MANESLREDAVFLKFLQQSSHRLLVAGFSFRFRAECGAGVTAFARSTLYGLD
jgi:hypothetical protein